MKHQHLETTPETSKRMSKVKLKNGIAEQQLARELWHLGYRYRKNVKKLPGSPDIAISRYHIAIFVDGEFWHGKDWNVRKERLQRNREYWIEKIEENMARDERVCKELRDMGWIPIRFWEKDVLKNTCDCISAVIDLIPKDIMDR